MPSTLSAISSMATRAVLAELAQDWHQRSGMALAVQSVGGVDAARRLQAGEVFDLVFLASDAIDRLLASGHLRAGSRVDLMRSSVAAAVPAGAAEADIGSEAALRQAVLAAATIGYSTGPSGMALLALFERWGIADALQGKLVQAQAGVAVATLLARGEVALGFQQRSELLGAPGITLLGDLPAPVQINTVFSAGLGSTGGQAAAAQACLAFLASADAAAAKRRHGMAPV